MNAIKMALTATLALSATAVWAAPAATSKPASKAASVKREVKAKPTMTLADALKKVGDAAVNAQVMADITSQLSSEDQKAFLAEVNKAIAKLPGTADSKTERFVDANRAALLNAQKGNLSTLVTEMFATVEVASLPTIVETFSEELFNRSSDPDKTYVDAEYVKIAKEVINQVEVRTSEDKAGGARTTFAVLMFIRSSNGSKEVEQQLTASIANTETREIAAREWIPAALGETQQKTYDPILGYVGELQVPATETVAPVEMNLAIPETVRQETLLADLAESLAESTSSKDKDGEDGEDSGKTGEKSSSTGKTGGSTFNSTDASATSGKSTAAAGDATSGGADAPRTTDPTKPWSPEPKPYNNQTL